MTIASKLRRKTSRTAADNRLDGEASGRFYCLFETGVGWIGFRGEGTSLSRVTMGHLQRNAARQHLCDVDAKGTQPTEADWFPDLRDQFERFAAGEPIAFQGFNLVHARITAFQRQVFQATSALTYGATASYREIAERISRPKAARAVGNALGTNRFPILIPCHRVLASGGQIGGFTAPQGVRLKEKLLQIERAGLIKKS